VLPRDVDNFLRDYTASRPILTFSSSHSPQWQSRHQWLTSLLLLTREPVTTSMPSYALLLIVTNTDTHSVRPCNSFFPIISTLFSENFASWIVRLHDKKSWIIVSSPYRKTCRHFEWWSSVGQNYMHTYVHKPFPQGSHTLHLQPIV